MTRSSPFTLVAAIASLLLLSPLASLAHGPDEEPFASHEHEDDGDDYADDEEPAWDADDPESEDLAADPSDPSEEHDHDDHTHASPWSRY
jgi:hypothetical protein